MQVKKIAVLGAGLMGHGICQVAAQNGFEVTLRDIKQSFLDNGFEQIKKSLGKFHKKGQITEQVMNKSLDRIHLTLDLEKAVSDIDLVIEAVPENVEIKKATLKEIDQFALTDTIVASNTSSMSITELANWTRRPEKVCGMHFFNPPQLMKLVEIIKGSKTTIETIETIRTVAKAMNKEPVLVKKDSPGFIVNRILIPALNEAITLYMDGIADKEDIDKAIKLGLSWPMGPLKLIDYIGADTVLAIATLLKEKIDDRFKANIGLEEMVKKNYLGKKTGKGFYDWQKND